MAHTDINPQVDERIWQAWMQKNEAQDKVRFARCVRVIGLASVFLTLGALWRFTT